MGRIVGLLISFAALGGAFHFRLEIVEFVQSTIAPPAVVQEPLTKRETISTPAVVKTTPLPPKTKVYRWTDESGKIHFGDNPDAEIDAEQITVTPENVTEWKSSPKITPVYIPQERRSYSGKNSRIADCKRRRASLDRKERAVRRYGGSSGADPRIKEERWQILKNCQ